MMYPLNPMLAEPKCCLCIPLRFGCILICIIWAAFSMYMAIISFQSSSIFYTYMSSASITVFGVVNLILALVSISGIFIIITNVNRYVRTFSHAIFVSVFIVLVDAFVNIILFIKYQNNFHHDCIQDSSHSIVQNVNNTLKNDTMPQFDFTQDYYNCQNLWQDELKFGIIFYVLMFAFYVYWSFCIYSFSLVRRAYITDADIRAGDVPPPPVALPPNAGGIPAGVPFNPPNDQVIVLNNAKPSKVKPIPKPTRSHSILNPNTNNHDIIPKRRIDKFSFRQSIRKSLKNSSKSDHLYIPFKTQEKDSQFTIGFRLGPDGNIIDIEDASLSPIPAFINQQQLKRKPVSKEDEFEFKETYY
ncbi:uncharacterized protein BX663DRAFT_511107 [Cokeromyces recurvatus]|uniref:uncharacterized protein n=1 Tax=Cokeromyces recurvatus TaxID=90255 RepID=UPI00221E7197|nr:uncharacterized protein BX663DRAFT_511107 [Cokeromyces recurvatus]KAI7902448.1 hypothetical protein BX663DRAFT_511107 [Cokeromyces recurvatus]